MRAWLKTVTVMNASTPPSPPEVSPPPPLPPLPPLPPAPSDSDEFKSLMAMLEADPQVLARTGRPATMDHKSFHGSVHVWGSRDFHLWGIDDPVGGKATFTVTLTGPAGSVDVAWSGKTVAGAWKADSMSLAAPTR